MAKKTVSILPHIGPAKSSAKAPAVDAPLALVEKLAAIVRAEVDDRSGLDGQYFSRVREIASILTASPTEATNKRLAEQVRTALGASKGDTFTQAQANLFTGVTTLRKYTSAPYNRGVEELIGLGRWKFSRLSTIARVAKDDIGRFVDMLADFAGMGITDAKKYLEQYKPAKPGPSFETQLESLKTSVVAIIHKLDEYANPSVSDKESWLRAGAFISALDLIHDTGRVLRAGLPTWYMEYRDARDQAAKQAQQPSEPVASEPNPDRIEELEPTSVA